MGEHLVVAAAVAAGTGSIYHSSEEEGDRGGSNPYKSFFDKDIPPGDIVTELKAARYVLVTGPAWNMRFRCNLTSGQGSEAGL
ncbi:hypothetical protein [Paenibacillus thiaminolyticus]|uniref:hypothetical protein n=1 Tax=Paenibacillus thiaminolyticus TaxID=49283 RepID=UPI0011C358A7|nr:hypothetical protein [Paenibacillus thiaminolyticus]